LQPSVCIFFTASSVDFRLNALTPQQAEDFYELIAEKHQKSSFIFTSNRSVEAWVELFPHLMMGNAALDRLANRAYHIILEGESHRKKTHPHLRFTNSTVLPQAEENPQQQQEKQEE